MTRFWTFFEPPRSHKHNDPTTHEFRYPLLLGIEILTLMWSFRPLTYSFANSCQPACLPTCWPPGISTCFLHAKHSVYAHRFRHQALLEIPGEAVVFRSAIVLSVKGSKVLAPCFCTLQHNQELRWHFRVKDPYTYQQTKILYILIHTYMCIIYPYMHVYIYYIHIHAHMHIRTCIYTHNCTCTYRYIYLHVYMYVCKCVYVYLYACAYSCVDACMCI